MRDESLLVPIGEGLTFYFDRPEAHLRRCLEGYLAYFLKDPVASCASPIHVGVKPPEETGETLLEEPPLVVRRSERLTLFELPGIRAWCDVDAGRGGIALEGPGQSELDLFAGLVLAPMLFELAVSRGWHGIHAAGVAVGKTGVLLPGPSGAGKSTIFNHAAYAGHDVLSDDLVWLAPVAGAVRMYAFPRGAPAASPWPTTDGVDVGAVVCPEIAGSGASRLVPMALPELMDVLVAQSGFLSSGAAAGERFRALVRLARSVPAYRLMAGPKREEAPELLSSLGLRHSRIARRSRSDTRRASGVGSLEQSR